jgi:LytS/YehU family sensor histidine kinase
MNPHFIFNALSSIHSLMNPKDVNRASDYLGSFSRLLRSSLESSREEYILLEDEISSMKNYMDLQRLRYDEKFDYKINVDRAIDLNAAIIPPMLIQPFIENAIEHGIKHKEEPGNIHIRFKLDDKKISCEIEDNGIGREKAWDVEYAKKGKHKSLATEIIRDRIKILNKKLKHKINLIIIDKHSETEQPLGTMVRLDLPYILD